MKSKCTGLAFLMGALMVISVTAQVKVGDKAVAIEAEKLANTKIKSLKELKGRLLLYEYFAHW